MDHAKSLDITMQISRLLRTGMYSLNNGKRFQRFPATELLSKIAKDLSNNHLPALPSPSLPSLLSLRLPLSSLSYLLLTLSASLLGFSQSRKLLDTNERVLGAMICPINGKGAKCGRRTGQVPCWRRGVSMVVGLML